jgi:hypothetical protein
MPQTDRPTTARGFRVFARQERRDLRVVESSLAITGPHAWLYATPGEGYPDHAVQLSVDDARLVIAGLERFVEEAKAGLLDSKPLMERLHKAEKS